MQIYKFVLPFCIFVVFYCNMEVECGTSYGDVVKLINNIVTSSSALIKLNVGGKEYETTVDTLTRINNTFFTHLLSKPQKLQIDDKGRIFIDRDGDLFRYVLNYLRTGKFHFMGDRELRLSLMDEANFYWLNGFSKLLTFVKNESLINSSQQVQKNKSDELPMKLGVPSVLPTTQNKLKVDDGVNSVYFVGGKLLSLTHQIQLNKFYGVTNQRWQLLFKATVHGFSASTFHSLCDNKGPTMTIIKSTGGFLFGGFTKESWAGNNIWKSDAAAFLFTLTNPHGIAATKFVIHSDRIHRAINPDPRYGPTFGRYDIVITNNSNTNTNNYTDFGNTYTDTTGKGSTLFTGNRYFQVSDIEVFGLTSQ